MTASHRILVADDNIVDRLLTKRILETDGFNVVEASTGIEAWKALLAADPPTLAILDWNMPGMDGVDLCRQVRSSAALESLYVILLTGRTSSQDVVQGLDSGADDYIQKPMVPAELLARVRVGVRVRELQIGLANHIRQLEEATLRIDQLQGLLPMCCVCKKVRNDEDYWQQVEGYLTKHSRIRVTHAYCPECLAKAMPA